MSSRRQKRITEFGRTAGQLSVSLIVAGETLAGHPHQKLIEGAISFWRAGVALNSDKVCFGCRKPFGKPFKFAPVNVSPCPAARAPGACLLAVGSFAPHAAIGALCTACVSKSDSEIDQAAARMLRRITGPSGRWIDPPPNPQGVRQ
jgi:hypothetical protein